MLKRIKIGLTSLDVLNIYPYRYDSGNGKQVLRIELKEEDYTFDQVKNILKDCTEKIEYYESKDTNTDNLVKKNEYDNYSLDFNCQYINGIYSIEITRVSEQEEDIRSLSSAVSDLALLVGGMK